MSHDISWHDTITLKLNTQLKKIHNIRYAHVIMMTVIPHSVTHMFISQQTYDRHHQCSEHWFLFFLKQVTTSKKKFNPTICKDR